MLYLITGANGAGKTLNALKWVRERQIKENRPVCHNGRFEPVPGGELDGWKKIEFSDWQSEPDGTIFLIDECHNDLPVRASGAAVPDAVKMLAEHRRRGFDFYLVTQHPQNVDSFVRRLIGPPGWHRHLKRSFGVDMVSVLEWGAVNPNCEKAGSGKTGTITMQAFPKEVYGWYKSASLHTAKRSIPAKVWYALAGVVLIIALMVYLFMSMGGKAKSGAPTAKPVQQPSASAVLAPAAKLSVAEYLEQRRPRITGFPHTAPAYDEVTKPSIAPYPAACVRMGDKCRCYTQQATLMQVPGSVCVQIVEKGFFVDWQQQQAFQAPPPQQQLQPPQQQAQRVDLGHLVPRSPQLGQDLGAQQLAQQVPQPGSSWSQGLAARNAQVRSVLDH
jgi:zona occludens toxin